MNAQCASQAPRLRELTPFVGREAELAQLEALLVDPALRLVTILGPGGIGKTRLALEAVARPGRVEEAFLVSLAPLHALEQILPTVAHAVGYLFRGGQPSKLQLFDHLRQSPALLVMDSFEHLLGCNHAGAALVDELLLAAPGVRVLATSREPLHLAQETRFRIGGLRFPDGELPGMRDGPIAWETYSAVALFVQQARQVLPGLALDVDELDCVARICRMVEGMPLAIVLAAAWVETLSLAEIAGEIVQGLDLLQTETRNVPARHRSIRAVLDSTWRGLSGDVRQALMRMAVFRGGFTRDAAQATTGVGLHTLRLLVDKSLIRRDRQTGRYEMHELLRQYAEERLEASGTAVAVRDAHSRYYLGSLVQRQARSEAVQDAQADRFTSESSAELPLVDPLTRREIEVLRLIAGGLSNQEIADRLVIGLSTVKKHINRAYGKLGVHRRTQAVILARRMGLVGRDGGYADEPARPSAVDGG